MKFKPHDYQKTTIDFMMTHDRGLVILDMGLGKTVSSLTAIKKSMFPRDGSKPRFRRPLIIAPKIVSENTWADEIMKWDHLKNMKYVELDATRPDHRIKQFERIKDGVLTIMSESKIQWIIDLFNDPMTDYEWPWDAIFIDEITLFKSPKSKRFQNLRKKLQNRCDYVFGLTGTPAPNDLADLWAIMLLIDRGARLGTTKAKFNKRYCKGITVKINGGEQEITNYKVADEAYEDVLEAIEDVCIAMKASDYLTDQAEVVVHKHEIALPEKTYDLIDELTVERVLSLAENDKPDRVKRLERRIERYRNSPDLKKQLRVPKLEKRLKRIDSGNEITLRASHVFSLISIGRQLAGGAVYEALPETEDEDEIREALKNRRVINDNKSKVATAAEIIEATDDNVLVFYHYKHEAERLMKLYPDAEILNSKNSQKVKRRWNDGKIRVLLANPSSTKFGLNLQDGGHTIIWFGLDYSFEKYVQSNARLARQGQQSKQVDVHILAAKDTIDVDIEAAILGKASINDFVYDSLGADKTVRSELKQVAQTRISDAVMKATGKKTSFVERD